MCRCQSSPVGPRQARLLIYLQKGGNNYEKCVHAQGKGELAWETWPNRLVLRLSLQSENKTNDPLKSHHQSGWSGHGRTSRTGDAASVFSSTRTRDSWHTNKSVLIYRMVINAQQTNSVTNTTRDRYVYKGEEIWST